MNTKPLPAILALIAGFLTCIMSFVQGVDIAVFAKRFIIVCIVFFVIGVVVSIIINMNFKDMDADEEFEDLDDLDFESEEALEEALEEDLEKDFEQDFEETSVDDES